MPLYTPSATKAQLRQAISERIGDWWPVATTDSGSTTTAVCAGLIGVSTASIDNHYLLLTSGDNAGDHRRIKKFDPATGTITVARAYSNSVASGVSGEIHTISPALYTLVGNEAVTKADPVVYRSVYGHFITNSSVAQVAYANRRIGVPRNMKRVTSVRRGGYPIIEDGFKRANSTTAPGNSWVAVAGTWGITGEALYSVSDADADFVAWDIDARDGYIRAVVSGTLNHGSTVRLPDIAFHVREDYTGAIDVTTGLFVQLKNGSVDLRKNDGGTESSLTTATQTTTNAVDYVVEVQWEGSLIRVWVDDVLLISYNLLGTDLKYMEYPQAGIRETKGGSPGSNMRIREFYAYALNTVEVGGWQQSGDQLVLAFNYPGSALYHIEGEGYVTGGAADATYETITSDTTTVYQLATTDTGFWNVVVDEGKRLLCEHLMSPANTLDAELRAGYAQMLPIATAEAERSRQKYTLPRAMSFKHP